VLGWFFEFLKNCCWFWFFKNSRIKELPVPVLSRKFRVNELLLLLISKTLKNQWFSSKNRQRTEHALAGSLTFLIYILETALIYQDGSLT
jgi:hypothetical protein